MNCIGSLAIEKEIHAAEVVMKQPTRISVYQRHDLKYKNLLTPFAFEKYMKQSEALATVNFLDIDDNFAASGPVSNRIITRPLSCDCAFFSSMGIVCKHILAFRLRNELDLYQEETCLKRWTNMHYDSMLSIDYTNDTADFQTVQTETQRVRKKTHNEKFRAAKKECDTLCALMEELPQKEFTFVYKQLKAFVNKLQDGEMPTISATAASLMSMSGDSSEEISSIDNVDPPRMLLICIKFVSNQIIIIEYIKNVYFIQI